MSQYMREESYMRYKQNVHLGKEHLMELIDLSLDTEDQEWFAELIVRLKAVES